MTTGYNSNKGFQFGIIAVICFVVFLILKRLAGAQHIAIDTYTYIAGFIMILTVVSSLIGFFFAMKSIKEPKSTKKTIGLCVNIVLIILFLVTTVINIIDFNSSF